jgi:hypothetical protein
MPTRRAAQNSRESTSTSAATNLIHDTLFLCATISACASQVPAFNMRLRITVRRHGLPETPIIWNVDLETSTIAQLLEQVNDIIPIESSEWGFEDYAVELKGSDGVNFECLHFQQVGKVMKEDDEVM